MLRVLVSSLGSTAAQGLASALLESPDMWVAGADMREDHAGEDLCDYQVVWPAGDDPDFAEVVAAALEELRIDLYVPVMEPELRACAEHRAQLESGGARVLVSTPHAVQVCASKSQLALAMREAGLAVPAAVVSGERFPVFVRPDRGTGSRNCGVAHDAAELERLRRIIDAPIVTTEVVEGPEFSVDGFADADHELRGLVCRTRDEVRGGLAVRSTVTELPAGLEGPVTSLARSLGLVGFFNLQFREREGQALCFDLNPRPGGAMALSFAAGLDPAAHLLAFAGQANWPDTRPARVGTSLRRRWQNIIVEPDEASKR